MAVVGNQRESNVIAHNSVVHLGGSTTTSVHFAPYNKNSVTLGNY